VPLSAASLTSGCAEDHGAGVVIDPVRPLHRRCEGPIVGHVKKGFSLRLPLAVQHQLAALADQEEGADEAVTAARVRAGARWCRTPFSGRCIDVRAVSHHVMKTQTCELLQLVRVKRTAWPEVRDVARCPVVISRRRANRCGKPSCVPASRKPAT
jgi:hypothetical protein